MKKIIIFLTFILSCSKECKPALEIEKEGYKIKLLTSDGTLKEMENKVKGDCSFYSTQAFIQNLL